MSEFAGKTVLVSGAGRGQGRAIALAFAARGADIIIGDVGDPKVATIGYELASGSELQRAAEEAGRLGARVVAQTCDVRRQDHIDALFKAGVDAFGGIDIIVNNAGVLAGNQPAHTLDDEQWDTMIAVNLTGVWRVSRAAVPHLIERGGGRIINIASVAGLIGTPNFAHYCAAKHGVVGLTKAMAAELAARNITVNAICPGGVDTKMVAHSAAELAEQMGSTVEAAYEAILTPHLIKRLITSDEIAASALYLAGEAARSITGSCLSIDCGWSTT
ncbi:MAG TPA: SDR family NAD(P)-dependent oxidoreductase [Sphingomonas sp.]|nr:SDR family NAD(P)-dependent oxidoreductase [Sphingomonas sp.]